MVINIMEKLGCTTLNELWKVAVDCNINEPGLNGTLGRVTSFIECKNVRDFMVMATLKCWEERGYKEMPPVIIQERIIQTSVSNQSKTKS